MSSKALLDLNSIDMSDRHLRERKEELERSSSAEEKLKTAKTESEKRWSKILCRVGMALFLILIGVALLIFSVSKKRSANPSQKALRKQEHHGGGYQNMHRQFDLLGDLTGYGSYQVWYEDGSNATAIAAWLQDEAHERWKISIGDEESELWKVFYFFENSSYLVAHALENGAQTIVCDSFERGYRHELGKYLGLTYSGQDALPQRNGTIVDVYSGMVEYDGNRENIEYYLHVESQLLMGIRRQVLSGGPTVEEEYWFGNNVTYHAPSEEEFQLPSICEHTASDTDL